MHFKDVERRLFSHHKANNKGFYRALLVAGAVLLPTLSFFIPLPGFWLLTSPVFDLRFVLSLTLLFVITLSLLKLHSAIISKRYFYWGMDTYGKRKFRFLYCLSRVKFIWPVLILLVLGFLRAELSLATMCRGAGIATLLITLIVIVSVRKLNGDDLGFRTRLNFAGDLRFCLTAVLSIYLRIGIMLLISLSIAMLTFASPNIAFDIGASLLGISLNLSLLWSCSRFLLQDLQGNRDFFVSVSVGYFERQRTIYCANLTTLWVVALLPLMLFVG